MSWHPAACARPRRSFRPPWCVAAGRGRGPLSVAQPASWRHCGGGRGGTTAGGQPTRSQRADAAAAPSRCAGPGSASCRRAGLAEAVAGQPLHQSALKPAAAPSLPPQGDKAAHNFLSEAVVRSLPKALSTAERERVLASTPLSPTLNLLSSMPLVRAAAPWPPLLPPAASSGSAAAAALHGQLWVLRAASPRFDAILRYLSRTA